jgi:ABC-type transporter Mla MlaB component
MGVSASQTVEFAIRGPITREDLPGLCNRVCRVLSESRAATVVCDVRGVQPDAVTVDALCRLQLASRRQHCQIRLRNASDELLTLVAFMGLADILSEG